MKTITYLRQKLEKAWSAETSYYRNYDGSIPAFGQCLVTALVVQDWFKGDIVRGDVIVKGSKKPVRHFWNIINGVEVDLTWSQFPHCSKVTNITVIKNWKTLLKNESVGLRYSKLAVLVGPIKK